MLVSKREASPKRATAAVKEHMEVEEKEKQQMQQLGTTTQAPQQAVTAKRTVYEEESFVAMSSNPEVAELLKGSKHHYSTPTP